MGLGRLGDPQAVPALEHALNSGYRSIRAHSARALGALGDASVVPELIERLNAETDKGLQMAYASALGNLGAKESTPKLLELLEAMDNPGAAMELALSLARIAGSEHNFITLARGVRSDAGTTMSQAITAFRRQAEPALSPEALDLAQTCADRMARGDLAEGERLMGELIRALPADHFSEHGRRILDACATQFSRQDQAQRVEYMILALHVLAMDWQ